MPEHNLIVLDNGQVKVTGQSEGKEIVIEGKVYDVRINKEYDDYYLPNWDNPSRHYKYDLSFNKEDGNAFTVTERNTPMTVTHTVEVWVRELTPRKIAEARLAADVSDDTTFDIHNGDDGFGFNIVFKWDDNE